MSDELEAIAFYSSLIAYHCFCPAGAKEGLHDGAALGFEHAGGDFYLMIQGTGSADAELRVNRARAFISRAVNQSPDAGLYERARAHRARLDGGVHDSIRQPVIACGSCRFAQGDYFGVGRRVAINARAIARES